MKGIEFFKEEIIKLYRRNSKKYFEKSQNFAT
jgi:hypothetical protein